MEKQTTKFDDYLMFLNSLINRYKIERKNVEDKISVYTAIQDILERRSCGERIPPKDYANLKQFGCPEKSLVELFSKGSDMNIEMYLSSDDDYLLYDCPEMDCTACWQVFINNLTEAINESSILIKNTDFNTDKE